MATLMQPRWTDPTPAPPTSRYPLAEIVTIRPRNPSEVRRGHRRSVVTNVSASR